jgi:hypothetical protein
MSSTSTDQLLRDLNALLSGIDSFAFSENLVALLQNEDGADANGELPPTGIPAAPSVFDGPDAFGQGPDDGSPPPADGEDIAAPAAKKTSSSAATTETSSESDGRDAWGNLPGEQPAPPAQSDGVDANGKLPSGYPPAPVVDDRSQGQAASPQMQSRDTAAVQAATESAAQNDGRDAHGKLPSDYPPAPEPVFDGVDARGKTRADYVTLPPEPDVVTAGQSMIFSQSDFWSGDFLA